jgi:hypothetical protein
MVYRENTHDLHHALADSALFPRRSETVSVEFDSMEISNGGSESILRVPLFIGSVQPVRPIFIPRPVVTVAPFQPASRLFVEVPLLRKQKHEDVPVTINDTNQKTIICFCSRVLDPVERSYEKCVAGFEHLLIPVRCRRWGLNLYSSGRDEVFACSLYCQFKTNAFLAPPSFEFHLSHRSPLVLNGVDHSSVIRQF